MAADLPVQVRAGDPHWIRGHSDAPNPLDVHRFCRGVARLAHRALELAAQFGLVAALAGLCHTFNVLLGYATDPQFERKEAIRFLSLALSIDDSDPETLAMTCLITGFMVDDYESAIEMADRAVGLNPNSYMAWLNRSWIYKTAGLPKEAIRSFEHAVCVSPVDPQLHLTFVGMAAAYIELRRFDQAVVAAKKAQRLNSSEAPIYRCLASAFAHLGRDAGAREAAARMLEVDICVDCSGRAYKREAAD
jgi:adenylate cyclase